MRPRFFIGGDRRGVLLRHVVLQPLLDGQRPRPAASADRQPEIAFHALRVITVAPMTGARPMSSMFGVCRYHWNSMRGERGRRHGFDHAGRQPCHDVGHRHRARLEAVRLEPLHHAIVAGRRVQLRLLEVVDRSHGLLREHLRPAAVSPVEQDEALGFDALADRRRQLRRSPRSARRTTRRRTARRTR